MDLLTLEVGAAPHLELAVGDYVELIGGAAPLEEVAALGGTVNYELLTGLSRRAQRIYR
jgi:alanine racemase